MLGPLANAVVRLVLAPSCAACGRLLDAPLRGAVCHGCWQGVRRLTSPLCDLCGDALPSSARYLMCGRCLADPPPWEAARSAGIYEGSLRAIVHAFKYDGRRTLAAPLAGLLREAGASLLADADAVVPVPLHPWRALRRGFNQAEELARHLGLPVWRPLRRIRHGPPQANLRRSARLSNARQAYGPARLGIALERLRADRLRHRVCVLVDDVLTTGATMAACTEVLLEAGVSSVRALTVARAPTPPRPSPQPGLLRANARHR